MKTEQLANVITPLGIERTERCSYEYLAATDVVVERRGDRTLLCVGTDERTNGLPVPTEGRGILLTASEALHIAALLTSAANGEAAP